jgi:hypothetical protein
MQETSDYVAGTHLCLPLRFKLKLVFINLPRLLIAGVATSFVLKQKKQKFKSPPACFFAAQSQRCKVGQHHRLLIFCPGCAVA